MLQDPTGQTRTALQPGDVIVIDTNGDMVRLLRSGESLTRKEDDDDSSDANYWISLGDGVQIRTLVQMLADACGFSFEEIEGSEYPTYRIL